MKMTVWCFDRLRLTFSFIHGGLHVASWRDTTQLLIRGDTVVSDYNMPYSL